MRRRLAVILCAVLGLGAPPAFAGVGDFIPTPWENGAWLEIYGSYERDDISRVDQPYAWNDTFLREKITLFSDGFVYHPRFMQYHMQLGGALKQERYSTSYLDPEGWTESSGVEYDARLYFLPEHPYNLELFALRYEPLYKEQAATQHDSVETSEGVDFRYRKKPWLFHSRYSQDSIDSGVYSTDIERLTLDGEYFKRYLNGNQLSFNAAWNPSNSSTSEGLDSDTDQYLFGNLIDLRTVRLDSSVTSNDYTQSSDLSGDFTNNQFAWREVLSAYFPWNLRSDLTWRRLENDSTIPDPVTGIERDLTDNTDEIDFELVHRLYESLDTSFIYLDRQRESSGGDTDSQYRALNLNYTKAISDGRVNLGANFGRGRTDNQGRIDVLSEPHLALAVPGQFILGQQNVEAGSIVVFLRSPLPPFATIQLFESVHYILTPVGNTFEVDIFALPPAFVVPGTYDFLVSYSLTAGEYELASTTRGYSAAVDLFNTMLTPYYNYVAVRSDLLSGVFPGTPLDSTTNTAGVRFQRGPWRARGEYQDLEWEVSPYHAWRAEMQYIGALNPTLNFYGTASYLNRHYEVGTSNGYEEPYTDQTTSASGSVRKEVPDHGLSFSVGATVSYTDSLVDTNAFSLNSSLTWKVGKLIITGGANAYSSWTRGGTAIETDRAHQYYYVTVRRLLF